MRMMFDENEDWNEIENPQQEQEEEGAEPLSDIPGDVSKESEDWEAGAVFSPWEPEQRTEEEPKPAPKKRSVGREILSWVGTILLALVLAVFLNTYVFRISEVNGPSMQPTLYAEDVVYLSRMPYLFGSPEYGDIIVFDSSLAHRNFFTDFKESLQYNMITQKLFGMEQTRKYWIKRVIGLPGDVIEARDGKLYRNGDLLQEDYVKDSEYVYRDFSVTVSEDYIFAMGDNRGESTDSRVIGPVPMNDILGKVISIHH